MHNLSIEMRPTSLNDFIGNEIVVAAIHNQLRSKRVPIAVMFSGSPGTGKTTLARILAKELQPKGVEPDILETNGADHSGVDFAREVVQSTNYLPLSSTRKIIIIDEAQKLTDAAQNCLLKAMENPDSFSTFIFCTTEPTKLIPALRSRCLTYRLSPLTDKEVASLVSAAEQHLGFSSSYSFATLLCREGVRSPREILMAFEKFASGMPPEQSILRTEESPEYLDIARAVWKGDWGKTSQLLKELKSADVRGLRAVVAGYGKKILLDGGNPVIADCLTGLAQYQVYEDGIALAITTGTLFKICAKVGK